MVSWIGKIPTFITCLIFPALLLAGTLPVVRYSGLRDPSLPGRDRGNSTTPAVFACSRSSAPLRCRPQQKLLPYHNVPFPAGKASDCGGVAELAQ